MVGLMVDLSRWSAGLCRSLFLPVLLMVGVLNPALFGAENTSSELDYPLVVFNMASMQKLRDHAGLMFESADRKEMTDVVDRWTVETLKETKGLDRNRPFGMMLYLNTESFFTPLGITYLPVENLDEALQTLAYGTGTITPVEGNANRHEIRYGESFKIRTLYRNRYLFMVGPDGNETSLDWNFPDPEKMTSRLSTQHDVAVSFLIKSIPIGLKTVAMAALKSQMLADLQQRDNEPESAYRLRRASGEGWVEMLDKIANQGEEFTIGGRIDPETKLGRVDIEIAGTGDSKLAKLFQNMTGKRTYFGNLLVNPATFTMSSSWQLDESQRKLLGTYFEAAERDLTKNADKETGADLAKIVAPLFKTLQTSADVGHLDAFAQLTGSDQESFVLTGGIKLANSRNLPTQLMELVEYFKSVSTDNELLMKLELGMDSIDSFPVHRLPIDVPDAPGQRMFGKSAQLYLYASSQAVWFVFGGESALTSLRDALATVAQPQAPQEARNRVPFQFITHAKNWLSVGDTENPNAVIFNERAQASFESDNDAMTMEIRPTDRGVRIRTEFQSGFLSLMGRGVSSGIDNGFFQRPPGAGGRNRGRGRGDNQPAPAADPAAPAK